MGCPPSIAMLRSPHEPQKTSLKIIFPSLLVCLIAAGSTFAAAGGAGSPGMRFPSADTRILVTAVPTYRRWASAPGDAVRSPCAINGLELFSLCVHTSADKIQDCCLELQALEMRLMMGLLGVCSSVLVSPQGNIYLALKSLFRNSEQFSQTM